MSWLERNNLIIDDCCIVSNCSYCLIRAICLFSIEFHNCKELFCSKKCAESYCSQMKDMII